MRRLITAAFWIALYLLAVTGPLFLMLVAPRPVAGGFGTEFSRALGFVGLMQMALQFTIIARYRHVTEPYGIDLIMQYHKQIAFMALVLILIHPAILLVQNPRLLALANPFGGTAASRAGTWSVLALVLLVALSLWRQRIGLNYEWWRVTHTLLGLVALGLAYGHIALVGRYTNTTWKHGLWLALGAGTMSSLLHLRLIRPILQSRNHYRVSGVSRDRGRHFILAVEPVGHPGMRFLPGQFAWLKVGTNPFTIEEHPFSFSSSAETAARLEFGIKASGDFTGELKNISLGKAVYLDGPYGSFSIDLAPAAGYVFIAGGIGITPMICFLRTMADRDDVRPVLLIYGAKDENSMAFRDEIAALRPRLNLQVVLVVEKAAPDWQGERGLISTELLARHLPREKITRKFFFCGPLPMMDAVEASLVKLGVPAGDIHSERFNLI